MLRTPDVIACDAVQIETPRERLSARRPRAARDVLLLSLSTIGAVLIHGYHGGVEDAEIYLPGILKRLNPPLFPWNTAFFGSHAGMTIFPRLVADSIRLSHMPAGIVLLLWHTVTVFALLFACLRIARLCFRAEHDAWCGVALIASLLTLPVAGTALYIMDQYVTSRSFSTAPPCWLWRACWRGGQCGRRSGPLSLHVCIL